MANLLVIEVSQAGSVTKMIRISPFGFPFYKNRPSGIKIHLCYYWVAVAGIIPTNITTVFIIHTTCLLEGFTLEDTENFSPCYDSNKKSYIKTKGLFEAFKNMTKM